MVTLADICPGNAQDSLFNLSFAVQFNLGPAIFLVAKAAARYPATTA